MRSLFFLIIPGALIMAMIGPTVVRSGESAADEALFAARRERMVAEQIQGRDIADPRVLAAMRKVPRHRFVPERLRPWLGLNPMAGVVEGFRWALLDRPQPPGPEIAVSAAVSLVLLASGILFFERLERSFADLV